MTTLAVVGDIHGSRTTLNRVIARIREVDVQGILLVGDIGSHDLGRVRDQTPLRVKRYLESFESVLRRLGELGLPIHWVPGNHDLIEPPLPGNIDGKVVEVGGLKVGGIGGAGPHRYGFPYEWSEDEVRQRPSAAVDVWLVHTPPARTPLDWVPKRRTHAGSEAIRERALSTTGFMVCGHIHESPGAIQLNQCLVLNAGGLGRPFGRPQVGFIHRGADGDRVIHEDLKSGHTRAWRRL